MRVPNNWVRAQSRASCLALPYPYGHLWIQELVGGMDMAEDVVEDSLGDSLGDSTKGSVTAVVVDDEAAARRSAFMRSLRSRLLQRRKKEDDKRRRTRICGPAGYTSSAPRRS